MGWAASASRPATIPRPSGANGNESRSRRSPIRGQDSSSHTPWPVMRIGPPTCSRDRGNRAGSSPAWRAACRSTQSSPPSGPGTPRSWRPSCKVRSPPPPNADRSTGLAPSTRGWSSRSRRMGCGRSGPISSDRACSPSGISMTAWEPGEMPVNASSRRRTASSPRGRPVAIPCSRRRSAPGGRQGHRAAVSRRPGLHDAGLLGRYVRQSG